MTWSNVDQNCCKINVNQTQIYLDHMGFDLPGWTWNFVSIITLQRIIGCSILRGCLNMKQICFDHMDLICLAGHEMVCLGFGISQVVDIDSFSIHNFKQYQNFNVTKRGKKSMINSNRKMC